MPAKINPKAIGDMAASLDNEELGAAVRLLARILSKGVPVDASRARTICQMDAASWSGSEAAILENFLVHEGRISHAALEEASLPPVSSAAKSRAGSTPDIPLVQPTRDLQVPGFATRSRPELISFKKTAFDLIVDLFARCEQSENTARAVLAGLLKSWPEGDVYTAIQAAHGQGYLVQPRSWIVKHLQNNSTPISQSRSRNSAVPPPSKRPPRKLVTPEDAGVSSGTADLIRQKNATTRLTITKKGPRT